MHILLIHQAFASDSEPGGTRHYELARYLVKEGHQVTIVASNVSYLTGKRMVAQFGLVRKEALDSIQVLRVCAFAALHRSFVWRVVSFFSFMFTSTLAALRVRNVDLVMGTSPPRAAGFDEAIAIEEVEDDPGHMHGVGYIGFP